MEKNAAEYSVGEPEFLHCAAVMEPGPSGCEVKDGRDQGAEAGDQKPVRAFQFLPAGVAAILAERRATEVQIDQRHDGQSETDHKHGLDKPDVQGLPGGIQLGKGDGPAWHEQGDHQQRQQHHPVQMQVAQVNAEERP
jgi:hypothetical protein